MGDYPHHLLQIAALKSPLETQLLRVQHWADVLCAASREILFSSGEGLAAVDQLALDRALIPLVKNRNALFFFLENKAGPLDSIRHCGLVRHGGRQLNMAIILLGVRIERRDKGALPSILRSEGEFFVQSDYFFLGCFW